MNDSEYKMYYNSYKNGIFGNCFTLRFAKDQLEQKYQAFRNKAFSYNWIKIFISTVLLPLLLQIIVVIITFYQNTELAYFPSENTILKYYQCIVCALAILNLVLWSTINYCKINNENLFLTFQIINYLTITITILSFYIFFYHFYEFKNQKAFTTHYKFFASMVDTFIKLNYFLFIENRFIITLSINLFHNCIYVWYEKSFFVSGFIRNDNEKVISIFTILMFMLTFLSYIFERSNKINFYIKNKIVKTNLRMTDLINQMQNGVIIWKKKFNEINGHISYINNFVKNLNEFTPKLNNEQSRLISNNELVNLNIIDENQNKIEDHFQFSNSNKFNEYKLFNIFQRISEFSPKIKPIIAQLFKSSDLEAILFMLNSEECLIYFKDFIFIGTALLSKKSEEIENLNEDCYLNVFLRVYNVNESFSFEIVMNDVTRTIVLEENKIKIKTLMLAKITHEFKNPLIVIDESIEQVVASSCVENNQDISGNIKKIIFIQNLCKYMILLVKYFECISNIENKIKLEPCPEKVDLKTEVENICSITKALMHKSNKGNDVTFDLYMDNLLPKYIIIDKMKLQQVLINLLSNSIKFTSYGNINLRLELVFKDIEGKEYYERNRKITETLKSDNKKNSEISSSIEKETNELVVFSTIEDQAYSNALIRFSVIDTGTGIPEEIEKSLFSGGPTLKESSKRNVIGSGYGLSIVHEICNLINSKLVYERNHPLGSVFYFDLGYKEVEYKQDWEDNISERNLKLNNSENNLQLNQHTKGNYLLFHFLKINY